MKPASLIATACALLIAASAGCHDSSATNDLLLLNTETLDAPTTIARGATLTLGLNVEVGGCLTYDHIESHRTASQVALTVWGRDIRTGITDRAILCPTLFLELHEFQLDPPFQSPFTVQVDRGRLAPLTATVQVH